MNKTLKYKRMLIQGDRDNYWFGDFDLMCWVHVKKGDEELNPCMVPCETGMDYRY